jgi:phosphate-selective porin OprO and OprP
LSTAVSTATLSRPLLVYRLFSRRMGRKGGRQTDFTLGLNWYPDKGIRFMANWVNVFQYSANFNRPDLNGIHPNIFILRAQVDW